MKKAGDTVAAFISYFGFFQNITPAGQYSPVYYEAPWKVSFFGSTAQVISLCSSRKSYCFGATIDGKRLR